MIAVLCFGRMATGHLLKESKVSLACRSLEAPGHGGVAGTLARMRTSDRLSRTLPVKRVALPGRVELN